MLMAAYPSTIELLPLEHDVASGHVTVLLHC